MKKFISFLLITIALLVIGRIAVLITGEFMDAPKNMDIKQLNRVDVKIQTDGNSKVYENVFGDEELRYLRELLADMDWEQNQYKEMQTKEDTIATLFFRYNENQPEKLVNYYIWFDQDKGTAVILNKEKKELALLDKENAEKLKNIFTRKEKELALMYVGSKIV